MKVRFDLNQPLRCLRSPSPSHLPQRPEPLQKGQGAVSSSIVALESSEKDCQEA
jgi:hypothetical protein